LHSNSSQVFGFRLGGQLDSPAHLPSLQVLFPLQCMSDSHDLSSLSSKHGSGFGVIGFFIEGVEDGGSGIDGQPDSPLHFPSVHTLFPLHYLSDSQDLSGLSMKHLIGYGEGSGEGVGFGGYGMVGQPDSPLHFPSVHTLFPLHYLSDSQDLSGLSMKHLIGYGEVSGEGVGVDVGHCGHPE